jgi:hypothetical protein
MSSATHKHALYIDGNEVSQARQIEHTPERDEFESTPLSSSIKTYGTGQEDVTITVAVKNTPSNARFIELFDAWKDETTLSNVKYAPDSDSYDTHYDQYSVMRVVNREYVDVSGERCVQFTLRPGESCVHTSARS